MTHSSDGVSRRSVLAHGGALVGGITAAATLPATANAAPKTESFSTGSALPDESANLYPPEVQIQGGKLRGFRDGKTFSFLGVPYAQAERFGMPQPVAPWSDAKSAQAFGPVCPVPPSPLVGLDEFVFPHRYWVENENCQVLNIWTQSVEPGVRKPVMVWMHGGGFTNGSSIESYAYDGKSLSEFGDVVVVSINHRLNILGTLDLSAYGPEYANSRNTGMSDIVAALQWVHDNIEMFGGDPGNVTVFGQSGGGAKVTRLMYMPAAKDLFHKVICQSGGGGSLANYRQSDPAKSIQEQHFNLRAYLYMNHIQVGDHLILCYASSNRWKLL